MSTPGDPEDRRPARRARTRPQGEVVPDDVEQAAERGAERGAERFIEQSISYERSSMLPDPEELARYHQHFPGLGERIVGWTEEELLHRRAMDRRLVDSSIRLASRGQLYAFTWSVLALLAAVILGVSGSSGGAIAAVVGALAPVAIALVTGVAKRDDG